MTIKTIALAFMAVITVFIIAFALMMIIGWATRQKNSTKAFMEYSLFSLIGRILIGVSLAWFTPILMSLFIATAVGLVVYYFGQLIWVQSILLILALVLIVKGIIFSADEHHTQSYFLTKKAESGYFFSAGMFLLIISLGNTIYFIINTLLL